MDSISVLKVCCAIIVAKAVATTTTTTAADDSITPDSELEALNAWPWPFNNSKTDHCKWSGITCNDAGRVAEMIISPQEEECGGNITDSWRLQFHELDVLAFPYLTKIHLTSTCSNKLSGEIPKHIGNLSNLAYLNLSRNNLSGELPLSLANLTSLKVLDFSYNYYIWGAIPQIGNLKSLVVLDLSYNSIRGILPSSLGQLTSLVDLDLSNNQISGSLHSSLGQLTSLVYLELSNNRISGSLPPTLGQLISLVYLDLNYNSISGSLPSSLSRLKSLNSLIFDYNKLEVVFGLGLANLSSIRTLSLRRNSISGQIPIQLGYVSNAPNLSIYLSGNNLTGGVPESLSSLHDIDLSYNHLEGPIPTAVRDKFQNSFIGNPRLLPPNKESRHQNNIQIILPVALFFACSIFGGFLVVYYIKSKKTSPHVTTDSRHGDIFNIWNYDGKIAFDDIIESTADFDLRFCIGTGGYGSVYRAELTSGRVVAVKKLHRFEGENPNYIMCFRNEAKVLSEIRHRNIVRLFGFCLHNRCMFLIYDYMERGSLFCVLRDDDEAVELNWMKRVNIVKGIADALSYMHHDCSPPILHRDIASSNILLNSKLEACVSDFGTARFLDPDSSNQALLVGTRGYIAPDHPADFLSSIFFTKLAHNLMLQDLLDKRPLSADKSDLRVARDVVRVVKIALKCINPDPKSRPSMSQVSQEITVHAPPLRIPFRSISMLQLMHSD